MCHALVVLMRPVYRRSSALIRPALLAGCGLLLLGCATRAQTARPPMSAAEHLAEAERHDADARSLEDNAAAVERTGAPTPYTCGDTASTELVTSGTERLHILPPCWAGEVDAVRRDRQHAAQLRADAHRHRIQARELVRTEQKWCAGLPEAELDHTPFDHREDLRGVQAELEGDRVRGARILFKPVKGLSADWMRQTLACHQAMATREGAGAGPDHDHLASCPSTVSGARTEVLETPEGLEVVVRAIDPAAALVIYARAEALLGSPAE
jgi:hypothetical protein